MAVLRNLRVPLSDGYHIAVDVYLPQGEGRHPTVFYFGPYRKDDFYPYGGAGKGLSEQYVERGIALVLGDVRGTNDSEGVTRLMWDIREQRDGYEVVEWIARQPWCNGNVGMTGTSYGFWTSLLTAAQNPPHLRTVVPLYGTISSYYCFNEGGLPMTFGYHADYLATMLSFQVAPPGFRDPEGRWRELWKDRLATYRPWGLEWFDHLDDDQVYWQISSVRSLYNRIRIPVFAIGGWWDRYPDGPLKLYENLKCETKVLIGPWQHIRLDMGIPGPRVDYDIVFRWFEYWLRGEQNGIMEEPRITIYTQHYAPPTEYRQLIPGAWRQECAWPIPHSRKTRLYLSAGAVLGPDAPSQSGSESYRYDPTAGACSRLDGGIYGGIAMPVDLRPDESKSLIYSTAPLEESLEIMGNPVAKLYFASSARIMGLFVRLCDVAADGTVALVTRGQLNVAHREGLNDPKELTPGSIYAVEIAMKATAYLFQPGHRIRLAVASAAFPSVFPTREHGINTVYWGPKEASYLELPVVPGSAAEPHASIKTLPAPPEHSPTNITYKVEQDVQTGESIGVREANLRFPGLNGPIEYHQRTAARVHSDRPADATVGSEVLLLFNYDSGQRIESRGKIEYEGNAATIEMKASVRVTVDSTEEFSKSWSASYVRKFV
jgi:predicted acyl esterase